MTGRGDKVISGGAEVVEKARERGQMEWAPGAARVAGKKEGSPQVVQEKNMTNTG